MGGQILKSLVVVLGVALVCSFVVTSTAVLLEERQQRNLRLDRIRNILAVVQLLREGQDPFVIYRERIVGKLVDLHQAREIDPSTLPSFLQPDVFDFDQAARDPSCGEIVSSDRLGLKRRPRYMPVYFVRGDDGFDRVILLVVGKGLWSTLYGYLALERDLTTIAGITFYQQGETPGLGGEITDPVWQAGWRGKRAYDEQGRMALRVIKGRVSPNTPRAVYQVEGLSGATLTTRGVDQLVRYWLGPEGYGPYLGKLRNEGP